MFSSNRRDFVTLLRLVNEYGDRQHINLHKYNFLFIFFCTRFHTVWKSGSRTRVTAGQRRPANKDCTTFVLRDICRSESIVFSDWKVFG